jgi:hypothetical protein
LRYRHWLRILPAALAASVALTGCGVVGSLTDDGDDSPAVASSPPDDPSTYNPDATGEVVGSNCRYHQGAYQFSYDVSIQNASPNHAFTYSVDVEFTGGAHEWSDGVFGSQSETITVGAGLDRKITVTYGYELPTDHKSWYGCTIDTATKTLAD